MWRFEFQRVWIADSAWDEDANALGRDGWNIFLMEPHVMTFANEVMEVTKPGHWCYCRRTWDGRSLAREAFRVGEV